MYKRTAYAGLIAAVLVLLAVNSIAQTIVPLPDLTGTYDTGMLLPNDAPNRREIIFVLPSSIQAIDSMRLVLSGQAQAGLLTYPRPGGPPDSLYSAPFVSLFLTCSTIPNGFFSATVQTNVGSFSDVSDSFESSGHVDANALIGAEIHGEMGANLLVLGWWGISADSIVNLSDVRIEVTGSVPNEVSSWGAVQALYR